jgi:hypothetical protein
MAFDGLRVARACDLINRYSRNDQEKSWELFSLVRTIRARLELEWKQAEFAIALVRDHRSDKDIHRTCTRLPPLNDV